MGYKVVVQKEAAQDFAEAKLWYRNTNVKGLSARFSNAVKFAIARLQEHPTYYAVRYRNVRIIHTNKFPYALHFLIDGEIIVIIAIVYAGRDPNISSGRLTGE